MVLDTKFCVKIIYWAHQWYNDLSWINFLMIQNHSRKEYPCALISPEMSLNF